MTKPVTGLTTFGSNTSGTTTQLDNNFLKCTAALNDLNTYPNFLTDTGTAGALVVTLAANLTGALTNGLVIQVKVAATNTGASTLNYNGGGALNVLNQDGTATNTGQLQASGIYQFAYRAADTTWILMTTGARGWFLLSAQQANANAAINFNNLITGAFDQYRLTISGAVPAGNDSYIAVQLGNGNAPTYQTTGYLWGGRGDTSGGAQSQFSSSGNSITTSIPISGPSGSVSGLYNGANGIFSSEVKLEAVNNANSPMIVSAHSAYLTSAFSVVNATFSGLWNSQNAITSVRVIPSNNNITRGNFALYGLVKS